MPYNTRNRSNTEPAPSQRPQKPQPPLFPPPGLKLHPDDESSKVFHALATALLAVSNRAMTIKDLAEAALSHGLVCSGTSPLNAASQQITSYIRLHQRRCEQGLSKPLLRSHILTGTSEDDLLTPALHSRAGGTATRRGGAVDTAFRKGTLVWYLSPETGAADPFQQAGIRLPGAKKRRRRAKSGITSSDSEEEKRPKIKLKIKLGSLSIARATADPPLPSLPTPIGSSETTPIILDSPPSSPTISCSLHLPPYPIQSRTRHLRDIPNSPFDLPEYASPPPDSEDDADDFHTSMMACVEDSDADSNVKEESDSDLEGSDGRRSRSTSWTTVTDPKTPRDVDRPLNHPAFKVEGYDISLAEVSARWDSFSTPDPALPVKREEGSSDLNDVYDAQDDAEDPMSLDGSYFMSLLPSLRSSDDGPDNEKTPAHDYHIGRNRSFSAPAAWRDNRATTSYLAARITDSVVEDDELEILGPDTIPPEEFDEHFWTSSESATVGAGPSKTEEIQSPKPALAGSGAFRPAIVDGIELYELDVKDHVLRRRVDDGRVHLTSLLRLLSNNSPSGDFLRLDGASHVKDGVLKGTWVPMQVAWNLVKGRSIAPELAQFLEGPYPYPGMESNSPSLHSTLPRPMKQTTPQAAPALLPAFELTPNKPKLSAATENRLALSPLRRRTPIAYDDDLHTWRHDQMADWKVSLDLESSIRFPLVSFTSKSPEQFPLHSNESPLSPQEEEIFHSLVDLGMSGHSEREREIDEEEDVLEADDEHEESQTQPRRSKRVAARSVTTRTKGPQPVSRKRSTRTK